MPASLPQRSTTTSAPIRSSLSFSTAMETLSVVRMVVTWWPLPPSRDATVISELPFIKNCFLSHIGMAVAHLKRQRCPWRMPAMTVSPTWGAAARGAWRLDPAFAYLNHGGFGVTPEAVFASQDRWRARIERNPTHFLTYEVEDVLRAAMVPVAKAIGAAAEDVVFVENATTGLNAVLRSLDFEPGDEILITSLAYPAIRKAAQYTAARTGARLIEAEVE